MYHVPSSNIFCYKISSPIDIFLTLSYRNTLYCLLCIQVLFKSLVVSVSLLCDHCTVFVLRVSLLEYFKSNLNGGLLNEWALNNCQNK